MQVIKKGNVDFFTANDVAKNVDISRQTLWRWRKDRKILAGYRLRNRQLLFSRAELEAIREYALSIEPIEFEREGDDRDQLKLFQ